MKFDLHQRWPWKWFAAIHQAALLFKEQESEFSVKLREHQLLRDDLLNQRNENAQRCQAAVEQLKLTTSNELERLKLQHKIELIGLEHERATALDKQKLALLEIAMLREEREKLITERDQAVEGTTTLYEFIRRTRVTDSMGRKLPEMSVLNQRLRR